MILCNDLSFTQSNRAFGTEKFNINSGRNSNCDFSFWKEKLSTHYAVCRPDLISRLFLKKENKTVTAKKMTLCVKLQSSFIKEKRQQIKISPQKIINI